MTEDYCLIIKPHPLENKNDYNKYEKINNILVTDLSSEVLLSRTDIHITMYSTTAFDALRYGIATFIYIMKIKLITLMSYIMLLVVKL